MEEEFSRRAVDFINGRKDKIKFVIVCGDLTHNLEGIWSKVEGVPQVEEGRKKRLEQLAIYKEIYSKLDKDIPLVCVCGNHDVGNKPTEKTIGLQKQEFGDDYLTFWAGGLKFIAMNTQLIQGPSGSPKLAAAHDKWLEEQLAIKTTDPVHLVVCGHIPAFCWDFREEESNFNQPMKSRKKWLDKMVEAGVKKMYCAHYHRSARGNYRDLEIVVCAPIGTYIKTKPAPEDIYGDDEDTELKAINFKLSFAGFGGLETSEETSGIMISTVTKQGIFDKWWNVASITDELNQKKKVTIINQFEG